MESATPPKRDTDFDLTVRRAGHDGADTAGLDQAVSESNDRLTEAGRGAAEADEHIREARRAVEQDTELAPRPEKHFYESGDEHVELDDQSISPPG